MTDWTDARPTQADPTVELDAEDRPDVLPLAVVIVTPDYEVRGLVHVSRHTRPDRRITELLNDPRRRFLAITDAELLQRHMPGSIRRYAFMQLQMDSILMMHPAIQQATPILDGRNADQDANRLNDFRRKLAQTS